jgi:hypothetical protein
MTQQGRILPENVSVAVGPTFRKVWNLTTFVEIEPASILSILSLLPTLKTPEGRTGRVR